MRERLAPPSPEPAVKRPLAERVGEHAPPSKPAAEHPWRGSLAVAGSAAVRCAHLRGAGHRDPTEGTLLLR